VIWLRNDEMEMKTAGKNPGGWNTLVDYRRRSSSTSSNSDYFFLVVSVFFAPCENFALRRLLMRLLRRAAWFL
jgi:hypothetical protein